MGVGHGRSGGRGLGAGDGSRDMAMPPTGGRGPMMSQSLPPPAPMMQSSLPAKYSLDSIPELTLPPPSPGAVLRPELHVRLAGVSSAPAQSWMHMARRGAPKVPSDGGGAGAGGGDATATTEGAGESRAESTTILGFLQSTSAERPAPIAEAAAADESAIAKDESEWRSSKAKARADDPLDGDFTLGGMEGDFNAEFSRAVQVRGDIVQGTARPDPDTDLEESTEMLFEADP